MTNSGVITNADREWAAEILRGMYNNRGSWDAVAEVLADYYKASRSAWWQVAQGRKLTLVKLRALRSYMDLPISSTRPRPNHHSLNIRRDTWEWANGIRKLAGLTWDELMREMLTMP